MNYFPIFLCLPFLLGCGFGCDWFCSSPGFLPPAPLRILWSSSPEFIAGVSVSPPPVHCVPPRQQSSGPRFTHLRGLCM